MGILLHAGSVAAALGSIFGLLVFFVPGLTPGGGGSGIRETRVVLPKGQEVKLGIADKGAVERMTYGRWLALETGSAEGSTAAERRLPGVDVHYTAKFPGFALGTPFRARFTLKDQAGVTRHSHVTTGRLDADRDECRCSEFVPVPVGPNSYRVLVELYRPGAPYAAPVLGVYTDWFSAAGPVTDG